MPPMPHKHEVPATLSLPAGMIEQKDTHGLARTETETVMKPAAIAIAILLSIPLFARGQAAQVAEAPPQAQEKVTAKAGHDSEPSKYLRIVRDEKHDEPIAMQTSIVSFIQRGAGKAGDKLGVTVDLIGAVHIADKDYFRKLNRQFRKYDALLYELVAPENNNVPQGGRSQHPVGQMQQGMKSMLELSYQLEEVDYTRRNFVHADMSPDEFARVMSDRNESWLSMMMKMMGAAMAMQKADGRSSDADLLFAFFADDRALRLKRVMSTQFGSFEGTMNALEGEDGSTIIGERNNRALDVLQKQLAKGKKRIGIFYGAGHLPDLEEKLAERFGLYPDDKSIEWLTAWDMSGKKK